MTLACHSADKTGPAYWIMDTGSCFHLINVDDMPDGNLIEDRDDVRLSTAPGPITVTQQTEMGLKPLRGPTQHLILKHTPAVLSIGRLCVERNFSFHWEGKKPHIYARPQGIRSIYSFMITYPTSKQEPKISERCQRPSHSYNATKRAPARAFLYQKRQHQRETKRAQARAPTNKHQQMHTQGPAAKRV